VYVVAAGRCYHAGEVRSTNWANEHTLGIEAEATGTAAWPEVQLRAYAALCRVLSDAFGGVPVLGHKEVCAPVGRKVDPNFDMAAFRTRVAQASGDDDVQLTDTIKLFNGETVQVQQVLAGIMTRIADPIIESERFPGHKDTLANFVRAIDGNVLNLGDALSRLTSAQQQTNAKLDKLIELLTPKAGA